jgi:DNA-binding MarR family transcriptional regulator
MEITERDRLADAVLGASRVLLAIAVRSVSAGTADVTVTQHRVLVLLDARGPLSVTAVAEELGVDQSNASRHCTRLARLGLVTRTRAAHDGRAVDVEITADGRRQVEEVRAARRREIIRILDRLSDAVVHEVVEGFESFQSAATGPRPDPPVATHAWRHGALW